MCGNEVKKDFDPSEDMIDMTQEELRLLASLKFTRMKSKTKVQSSIIQDIETHGTKICRKLRLSHDINVSYSITSDI